MKAKVGDKVTVLEPMEAYYSQYAGNPLMLVTPGMIGTVAVINVPAVYGKRIFNCVDFVVGEETWRVAASNNQIKKVKP